MQRAESPAPSTIGSSVFSSSPDWGRRGELRARCGIICPKRVEGAKEHNDCASERGVQFLRGRLTTLLPLLGVARRSLSPTTVKCENLEFPNFANYQNFPSFSS